MGEGVVLLVKDVQDVVWVHVSLLAQGDVKEVVEALVKVVAKEDAKVAVTMAVLGVLVVAKTHVKMVAVTVQHNFLS